MKREKKKKLIAAGFQTGTVTEFLSLTPQEEEFIEMRLRLVAAVRELRQKKKWNQTQLAKAIHSSQSRVAKLESGSADCSLDLVVKALISLGADRRNIAKMITA